MRKDTHGNYGFEDHGHCRYCGGYNGHHFVEKHSEETDNRPVRRSGGSPALLIMLILAVVLGAVFPPIGVILLVAVIIIAALK